MIGYIVINNDYGVPNLDDRTKVFLDKTKAINYRHEILCSPEFKKNRVMIPDPKLSFDEWGNQYYKIEEIEVVSY